MINDITSAGLAMEQAHKKHTQSDFAHETTCSKTNIQENQPGVVANWHQRDDLVSWKETSPGGSQELDARASTPSEGLVQDTWIRAHQQMPTADVCHSLEKPSCTA